mgnify:CR=1 FL=1
MKNIIKIILFLVILLPFNIKANESVNIYLFYSETCPHCHKVDKVINELLKDDKTLNYYKYECTKDINAYNRNILNQVNDLFEINSVSFPLVVIGNNYVIGYNSQVKDEYLKYIDFYKENEYKDQVGILLGLMDEDGKPIIKEEKEYRIDIPIIGEINLKDLSLPLIAIIIGFTDGFNPCAMWVLLFLITMLLNVKDKKKMWILGLTFIFTSGFIYFLFMMAWLKVTDYMNQITLLRNLIAIFAIIFGGYNLYNYFKTRKSDGCTVIKKEKRNFVIQNIKKVIANKSFIISIIGIIVIACLVNLVELFCSMGLPIMFTEILSLNNLSYNKYIFYICIYILFFMIDDILIFVISMITLKQTAISTKYNKYSHLIGGIIMILIGILMFLKPEWLSFNFN